VQNARVSIGYAIEAERRYYSVPYQLVKNEVDVRIAECTVVIFDHGPRVTNHRRGQIPIDRVHPLATV